MVELSIPSNNIYIRKRHFLYAIFIISQLSRSSAWLKTIDLWDLCMTAIQCYCLLYFVFYNLLEKGFSYLDYSVGIFYLLLLVSTVINSKDYVSWMTYTIQGCGSILLVEDLIKDSCCYGIKILRDISATFIIINLLTLILFRYGLNSDGYYFLGSRIGFTPFALLAVLSSIIYDYLHNDYKISKTTVCIFYIALFNLLISVVATGLITLLVIFVLCVYEQFSNINLNHRFNYWLWLTLALSITAVALVYSNIDFLNNFFSLFGKDTTFGGRTIIWHDAEYYIAQRPFLGYGVSGTGSFFVFSYYTKRYLPAHNEILNILYQGGITSTIVFLSMFITSGWVLSKSIDIRISNICVISIFTFGCLMITEIQTQKAILFIVIAMVYQLSFSGGKNG